MGPDLWVDMVLSTCCSVSGVCSRCLRNSIVLLQNNGTPVDWVPSITAMRRVPILTELMCYGLLGAPYTRTYVVI
jgi:hypothetical protein